VLKRFLRLALVLGVTGWIATALAALRLKQRLVPTTDPGADDVLLVGIFGPLMYGSRARAFRGGRAELWFGGGVIDLRSATLDPAGATLSVRVLFGGGQVAVPEGWEVETHLRGMGGVTDTRPDVDRPEPAPRLVIEGLVLFGGFQITSELSADMEAELAGPAPAWPPG
jgi:hypothetical protein